MTDPEFLELIRELYGETDWPKPLHQLRGARLVDAGQEIKEAARIVGTTPSTLARVIEREDRLKAVLGCSVRDVDRPHRERAIRTLGQLLVGRAAERAFEDAFREEMESEELDLRDLRGSRTDTDYRLYNGQGRPIYRINIKFHGALFKRAPGIVGLEPEDCFALATYKIHGALGKQEEEGLPYIFAVVGVRTLSGEGVGAKIPGRYIDGAALVYQSSKAKGKRDFEDRLVEHLVGTDVAAYREAYDAISSEEWYVLSASLAEPSAQSGDLAHETSSRSSPAPRSFCHTVTMRSASP
ncbi:MAG: hypothetical protein ACRELC_04960 [Gemmatimonadota bacterium]